MSQAIDPKETLRSMMSSFSERNYCASWKAGIEFILWKQVRECGENLTLRELADFNLYAGLSGGWWMWDEEIECEVFVDFDKWQEYYWKTNHPHHDHTKVRI